MVAPHDRFSKEAIEAAEKIGYEYICRGFSPLPREIQWNNPKYLISYSKLFLFLLKKGRKYRYPKILNFGKHKEIYSYRIQHINKNNMNKILKLHKNNVLYITNHYLNLNKKETEIIKEIIKRVK